MLDLSSEFLPLASFIAGLSGSLHCIGMCGGLVTASCHGGRDVFKYQIGRLLGYSILGSIAWLMGYALKGVVPFQWGPLVSGLFMGILFIYWGIQSFQGKKAEVPLPDFLRKSYHFAFRKFVTKAGSFRSFIVGFISIMLPCGLIYGLIIAALALGNYQQVLISLLFFWLGTLPAMLGAPQIVKKLLDPLKKKLPKVYAVIFIVIGVATVSGRLSHLPSEADVDRSTNGEVHQCH